MRAARSHVVGCDHGREARGADDRHQRREYVPRRVRIEVAGRLVGEENARRVGDRARHGDALLLAAREFRRTVDRGARPGPRNPSSLLGPVLGFRPRQAADELRHHHVFEGRELRQEVVELIDEADLLAAASACARRRSCRRSGSRRYKPRRRPAFPRAPPHGGASICRFRTGRRAPRSRPARSPRRRRAGCRGTPSPCG